MFFISWSKLSKKVLIFEEITTRIYCLDLMLLLHLKIAMHLCTTYLTKCFSDLTSSTWDLNTYIKLNYLAFLSLKWPFIEQHHNHIDLKLIPSTSININFLEINSWKKNNSPNSRIFNIKNQYSQTFFVSSPWKSGWNDGVLWMGLNLKVYDLSWFPVDS